MSPGSCCLAWKGALRSSAHGGFRRAKAAARGPALAATTIYATRESRWATPATTASSARAATRPTATPATTIGVDEAADSFEQVAKRLANSRLAFRDALEILEHGEERHFARLHGQYVRTGRIKQSLTGQGPDSIRDLHNDGGGLTFGTSVPYARFLVKNPRTADDGEVRRRKGKSAVLVLQPKAREAIVRRLTEYVTEPLGNDGL